MHVGQKLFIILLLILLTTILIVILCSICSYEQNKKLQTQDVEFVNKYMSNIIV
jgi:hypothetical protein